MDCKHEWEIAETFQTAFKMEQWGRFVCQKCNSYKEEKLSKVK